MESNDGRKMIEGEGETKKEMSKEGDVLPLGVTGGVRCVIRVAAVMVTAAVLLRWMMHTEVIRSRRSQIPGICWACDGWAVGLLDGYTGRHCVLLR